jgi:hypothetical protein
MLPENTPLSYDSLQHPRLPQKVKQEEFDLQFENRGLLYLTYF